MFAERKGITRSWAFAAVIIAVAFAAGLFVESQYLSLASSNNVKVTDNYPVGECLGVCQHNYIFTNDVVTATVLRGGSVISQSVSNNLITNVGENTIIDRQMACGATSAPSCAGPTNGAVYIALTTAASPTPAATDTTCFNGNEYNGGNGMNRALGTYSAGPGNNQHKISITFTYTGSSPVTFTGVCIFDAASNGNLFAEDALSSTATVSASGDQLTITWTFTH